MQSWAIVVGINEYQARAKQKKLDGAVADACEFAEWVLHPDGGNVSMERLFFWAHPWPQIEPGRLRTYADGNPPHWYSIEGDEITRAADRTRAPKALEIVRTAEMQGNLLREARFEDPAPEETRIFVFLAGHGLQTTLYNEANLQTCFVAGDFRADDDHVAAGLVPCKSFRRSLRNNRFDEVLFFLDCCRTDPSSLSLSASPICDLRLDREMDGWSIGHAAHATGRAYETKGPPIRGAFSQTLIDGLHGCRSANSELDVRLLDDYVRKNIGACTTMPQSPYFEYLPVDPAPVLVRGPATKVLPNPAGPRVRLAGLADDERIELLDGNGDSIWEGGPYPPETAEVTLPTLPKGLYALRVIGQPERESLFSHPGTEVIDVKTS